MSLCRFLARPAALPTSIKTFQAMMIKKFQILLRKFRLGLQRNGAAVLVKSSVVGSTMRNFRANARLRAHGLAIAALTTRKHVSLCRITIHARSTRVAAFTGLPSVVSAPTIVESLIIVARTSSLHAIRELAENTVAALSMRSILANAIRTARLTAVAVWTSKMCAPRHRQLLRLRHEGLTRRRSLSICTVLKMTRPIRL